MKAIADTNPLEPGIDGLDIPYPDPNDRVRIAIYDISTGDIRQTTDCARQDMHRQHAAWPGCDFIECSRDVTPQTHKIDLKTLTAVERVEPSVGDLGRKEQELWIAARDATNVVQSAASGAALSYPSLEMGALALACLVGGEIETAAGRVFHTEEQAKTLARDFAAARNDADAKLATLRSATSSVKTMAELDTVQW